MSPEPHEPPDALGAPRIPTALAAVMLAAALALVGMMLWVSARAKPPQPRDDSKPPVAAPAASGTGAAKP